jgi:hypothetical protein
MKKYRKKPVVIDAILLEDNRSSIRDCTIFLGDKVETDPYTQEKFEEYCDLVRKNKGIRIKTLEGEHLASFGDYIIKGIAGEFYPCKPEIFWKTYEEVK